MIPHNKTRLSTSCAVSTDKHGRESLVVVAKGTYGLPEDPDQEPRLLAEQAPLVTCDLFSGEPGFSAPIYEMDFAPHKPRCDVLLNGSAYAPRGQAVDQLTVSLRVGTMTKSFAVVGRRVWKAGAVYMTSTKPEPFTVVPISYGNAFGGVDKSQEDPAKFRWYPANFGGVGYHEYTAAKFIDGQPLPNTEEPGKTVSNPRGRYRPMAFGAVGRSWQPRIRWAGTYGPQWLDTKHPFLPDDFDERYFQCAPEDQQTDYLAGGEQVELINLTPQGRTVFRLPANLKLPIAFFRRDGSIEEPGAIADTLLLEPDRKRFMVTWRAALALRRNVAEVDRVIVGQSAKVWRRRAERLGRSEAKARYESLADLAKELKDMRKPVPLTPELEAELQVRGQRLKSGQR